MLALSIFTAACSDQNLAVFETNSGRHTFKVELALTPSEQQRGLMFRQELAPDAGMLFDFGQEGQHGFWMRNTFIPLDIIFIAADGEIKHIHPNARPHDTTTIPSLFPVRFVLEIPAGRSAEIVLEIGDYLQHPFVLHQAASE